MTDTNSSIDRVGDGVDFAFYASDNSRWRFVRLGRWYEKLEQRLGCPPAAYIRGVTDCQGTLWGYWAFSATPLHVVDAVVAAWNELGETEVDFTVVGYKGLSPGPGTTPALIAVDVPEPSLPADS